MAEVLLCEECFSKIKLVEPEFAAEQYTRHFGRDKYISAYCPTYMFEKDSPIQTLLHNMKYNKFFRNGIELGKKIAIYNNSRLSDWNLDLVIPVPLHRVKRAERGYNQAFYIGKGISELLNLELNSMILRRKKLTETQTMLHIAERKTNVSNAFEVRIPKKTESKNILLVDDVITTGSTINECAKVLLNAGAEKIYAASIALA
jgi:ComF family protein